MQTIKKIIITISKKNKDLPAYIFYQNNTEIQKSFHLDTETTEQAKEFLKIIKKNYYINETNCKIYCYDYNNKKIITIDSITEVNNHYLVGSNIEGITDLIRMIKTNCNKKSFLIPVEVTINNKTFFLNNEIINKKKGIQESKTTDIEEYLLFLKELYYK